MNIKEISAAEVATAMPEIAAPVTGVLPDLLNVTTSAETSFVAVVTTLNGVKLNNFDVKERWS